MLVEKKEIKKKKKRAKARIDQEYCTGCGICAAVCPRNCIKILEEEINFNGVSNVDEERCTGCNMCAIDCPWGAISMIFPDGTFINFSAQLKKSKGYV